MKRQCSFLYLNGERKKSASFSYHQVEICWYDSLGQYTLFNKKLLPIITFVSMKNKLQI